MERVPAVNTSTTGHGEANFFDDAPTLVAYASPDGRLTRLGGPWTELLGWSTEELTSRPFIEFVHPDDIAATITETISLNEGHHSVAFRNRYRTRRDSWVWLQWHARQTAQGDISAVATDVTSVVAREQELDRRRRIFEIVASYQEQVFAVGRASAGLEAAIGAAANVIGATAAAVLGLTTAPDGERFLEGLAAYGDGGLGPTGSRRAVIEGIEHSTTHAPTALEAASIVARHGRPIITASSEGLVTRAARELLAIPLARNRSTGIALFAREVGSFAVTDIEVLTPLLGAVASAVERDRTEALESEISAEVTRLSSMLGTMLERSEFTVIVTDARGAVENMNETAARTLGGRTAVEEHWPLDRLLAPGVAHGSLIASLAEYEGAGTETEWTFVDRAGRSLDLVVSASPIFTAEGSLHGWMLIGRPAEDRDRDERDRLERARLNAQVELLQRRERHLAALTEATQYVVASHTHREALDVIDHFLPVAFGPGVARLLRVHGFERAGQQPDPTVLHPGDCWSVRTGHTFHSEPGARVHCPHLDPDVDAICAPLGDGLQWTGVIVLGVGASEDAADAAAAAALLDDVARQLSNALANLRLRRALEEQAFRDPLTGVGNRRAADDAIAAAIGRARAHGEPFAVVMADLDEFKAVNDAFGHDVGDEVLVGFAEFLRHHTREDDAVTRIGGEEFLIILRDIPRESLDRTVEALRTGASEITVRPGLRITASFGAVHTTDGACSADDLVAVADDLMYTAKHAGRNAVVISDTDTERRRIGSPR
jgi:diguanylate cyclase (GGDEF)-like protein/PAS domain S-box-containing protein